MARRKRSNYRLGDVPAVFHQRSQFDLSYSHKTTMNVGDLAPLYVQEIYPGDEFRCDASVVARVTSSFLKPVMDNLFMDVMFFFVPSRTVFDKWAEIFGENNSSAWARESVVTAPVANVRSSSSIIFESSDLASYLGVPVGASANFLVGDGGINILPFRAYAKIYNEWFRDENLIDPVLIETGDYNSNSEQFNHNDFSPSNYVGKCAKVSKLHDYFTSCLPAPQKGDAVEITPLSALSNVPVYTAASDNQRINTLPLRMGTTSGIAAQGSRLDMFASPGGAASDSTTVYGDLTPKTASAPFVGLYPLNLVAQTSELSLPATTVNDLRFTFQLQRILERDAVYGTRLTEYIRSAFGVQAPDARLQRSEFLGGRRFPINVLQTVQTSAGTSQSPLGQVAGWSLTNGRSGYTKGFTEHGFVIGMFILRQFHTYQQGVEKFLWKHKRTDYLDPLFSSIGYQPVLKREIFADVNDENSVFGYAPIYEDLRSRPNRISGQLASAANSGLSIWHFADNYDSAPVLGQEFIEETPDYVDRTLSVPSTTVDQFIVDVYFKQRAVRVLPTYGMPGLIDHSH